MPRKSKITVPVRTTVEVDIDENIVLTKDEILESLDDADTLKELGFIEIPKNMSLIDEMKLELFLSILDKCTLDQLEKFKSTL